MEFMMCPQCHFRTPASKRMCQTCGLIRSRATENEFTLIKNNAEVECPSLSDAVRRLNTRLRNWLSELQHKVPQEVHADATIDDSMVG